MHAGTRQEDTGTRKHTRAHATTHRRAQAHAGTWHMLLRSLPVGPSVPLGSPGKHPVSPSGMLRISLSVLFPCSTDAAYSALTNPGASGPHAGGRGTSETSPGRPLATGHPATSEGFSGVALQRLQSLANKSLTLRAPQAFRLKPDLREFIFSGISKKPGKTFALTLQQRQTKLRGAPGPPTTV